MHEQPHLDRLRESASYIQQQWSSQTFDASFVLGSGLASLTDDFTIQASLDYAQIPGLVQASVQGHGKKLLHATYQDKDLLIFTGRFHDYQGVPHIYTATPAWISAFMNIPRYVLTNAAGGVNTSYRVGDIVLIRDHLNLHGKNPLRGVTLDGFDNPFFDVSDLYQKDIRADIQEIAERLDIDVYEGVYAYFLGPNFETPSEINALRILNADLVGMSSVPEALVAHRFELAVTGISVVTNVYPEPGQPQDKVTHEEVLQATRAAQKNVGRLLKEWIKTW